MKLEGTIEDIIFRNEENGYTVFILGSGLREITAVGFFPSFHAGAGLSLEGEYENTKYGLQFTVKSYEYTVPSTTAGMVKFLSSGLVKGIGPVTAGEIVKKFGDASFAVMRDAPERLASVRGISRKKALAIGAEYVRVFEMQETVMSLQKLDITLNLCTKIYKIYGKQSGDTVLKNPYKLVEDIEGVGFLTADKIARKAGIPPLSVFRIRAACLHALNENAEKSGNTYLPRGALASAVATLLGAELKPDEFYSLLEEWTLDGALKTVPGTDGEPRVFIKKLYQTEKNIAASLVKLKNAAPTVPDDFTDRIAEFERVNAVEFHESQIAAIQSALSSGVSVITGGPGTGKTTIIRCILHILKGGGKKVLLAAPTGRAAKRMQEAAKEEAMTLHRALGAEFAGGRSRFAYNEHNRLPYECVIVDEVSMIDCYLMNSLLKALSPGTRLLMVGDKDQLPSVGAGNVLADVLKSGAASASVLTKIYRQAEASLIITNAHRINRGEMPVLTGGSDFFFSQKSEQQDICDTIVEMVTERIPKFIGASPASVQVLAPMKAGVNGTVSLNARLQQAINPYAPDKGQVKYGDTVFRAGDRVMHIVNDYEMEWTRHAGMIKETGTGIFNGDIGVITSVFAPSGEINVRFEDLRECTYTYDLLGELLPAYAITVHKSQGCEFPVVVMPVVRGSAAILTRNLLYTAVTRAKQMAVLVGDRGALHAMVANAYTAVRYTMLADFLTAVNQTEEFLFKS